MAKSRYTQSRGRRGGSSVAFVVALLTLCWACDRTAQDSPSEAAPSASTAAGETAAAPEQRPDTPGASEGSGQRPVPSAGVAQANSGQPADQDEGTGVGPGPAEGLARSVVRETIGRYRHEIAQCRDVSDRPPGLILRVDVMLTIDPDGRVARARSLAEGGAAEACVVDVFHAMRFPEFSGPPMQLTYPVRIR